MKKLIGTCSFLLLFFQFISYAAAAEKPVKRSTYENRTIGIKVSFPERWELASSYQDAPDQFKALFKEKKDPDESPLFVGSYSNNQVFSRLLCEVFQQGSVIDYYDLLYATQKDKVGIVSAKYDEATDTVQWQFTSKIGQTEITFQETLAKTGDYVVRLGFWTFTPLFEKYKSSFDDITEKTFFLREEKGGKRWAGIWKDLRKNLPGKDIAYVETIQKAKKESASLECDGEKKQLLWMLKGKTNTVYLFGSIHLGKPEFFPFVETVESSFGRSKRLVVELDSTSKEFEKKLSGFMTDARLENGKTLQDVLSAGVYRKLVENMDKIGLPLDGFMSLKPWVMAVVLETMKLQSMGYMPDYGVDRYFLEKAAGKKEIVELESFEEQMSLFENIGQEKLLAYTLFSLNTVELQADKLIRAWRCGDIKTLEDIIFEDEKTSFLDDIGDIYKKIYYDRNKKMVDKIKTYLEGDGDYFVVVGAGHLIGDKGIVTLLKHEGLIINRL